MLRWAVLVVAIGIGATILFSNEGDGAEFILTNCKIWTADQGQPWADAMAIKKGRILRIGTLSSIQEVACAETEYLDLDGKFVAPGFIDSHVHFISGGLQMAKLNLQDVRSRSQLEGMIQGAVKGGDDWILGYGWSNEKWGGEWPNRIWIDKVSGKHPVWLTRVDGHMGLANTVALEVCNLTDPPASQPEGGNVVLDESGVPTGLLVDSAMELILPCIPKPSLEERRDALVRASKHALSKGVTSVVDFGTFFPGAPTENAWRDFHEVYSWADSVGSMSVRAALFFPLETWHRVAAIVKERGHTLSNWIRINGVKAFADGSLGSGSALFHEAYTDDRNNFGFRVAEPEWLAESVTAAVDADLQVAVHAIGDAANDEVLQIFHAVNASKSRLRVEHAQHLSPGAHADFGHNSVIASVQPQHLLDDAFYAGKKLGEERSLRSYNFRSLLASGTALAFGSDWPAAPPDPLAAIKAATERIPYGLRDSWIPDERISVADALAGHTISAAFAAHLDELVGSLESGKMADFVVLSTSPFESGAAPLVVATFVGGVKAF